MRYTISLIAACALGIFMGMTILGCGNATASNGDYLSYRGKIKTVNGYIDAYSNGNWTDVYVIYENTEDGGVKVAGFTSTSR